MNSLFNRHIMDLSNMAPNCLKPNFLQQINARAFLTQLKLIGIFKEITQDSNPSFPIVVLNY